MYCDERVCLSVCPHADLGNHTSELHQFLFACIACDYGSVLAWRRWKTLHISGFVDDVIFYFVSLMAHVTYLLTYENNFLKTSFFDVCESTFSELFLSIHDVAVAPIETVLCRSPQGVS